MLTLDIAEQFSKKLVETTKIPCSQKNLSHFRSFVEQFCGKKIEKKKIKKNMFLLNDQRQIFFAVILIEKLDEHHRVSKSRNKKKVLAYFWMEKCK